MTFVDASELDRTIKRVALWVTTFLAVATALAMLISLFIADPIHQRRGGRANRPRGGRWKNWPESCRRSPSGRRCSAAATSQPGSIERRLAETYLRDNALRVRIR